MMGDEIARAIASQKYPVEAPAPFTILAEGSDPNDAASTGGGAAWRPSLLTLADTDAGRLVGHILAVVGRVTSTAGRIIRSAVQVEWFAPPDNGGESAAVAIRSMGGGPAIAASRFCRDRADGLPDYGDVAGTAVELSTDARGRVVDVGPGSNGSDKPAVGVRVVLNNPQASGFLVQVNNPADGETSNRWAFAVGVEDGGNVRDVRFGIQVSGWLSFGSPEHPYPLARPGGRETARMPVTVNGKRYYLRLYQD